MTDFRVAKSRLGSESAALHFYWLLWRELAALARQGMPLGRLRPIHANVFNSFMVERGVFAAEEDARLFLESLVDYDLFKKDGDDLLCPRFIALNGDLAVQGNRERAGGRVKAFLAKQNEIKSQEMELALSTPARIWVDEQQQPLASDLQRRVQYLVLTCDSALKIERPAHGWTPEIVQMALPVVRAYSDQQVFIVCRKIALQRDHPRLLGQTTERLLPDFKTIVTDFMN